jgi:hypothetical protein
MKRQAKQAGRNDGGGTVNPNTAPAPQPSPR